MKKYVVGKLFCLSAMAISFLIASPCVAGAEENFLITSPTIEMGGKLDPMHTCDGDSLSPEINWTGVPAGTKSFALNLWHNAPDQLKTYWILYGIPGSATGVPEGNKEIGIVGYNGHDVGYFPMCSKGSGVKEYNITVYALSEEPTFTESKVTREILLQEIENTTLAEDTLTFTYERSGAPSGGGDQQGPPPGEEGQGDGDQQGPPPREEGQGDGDQQGPPPIEESEGDSDEQVLLPSTN
jgi:phosphatidylethanolamine-binding protein (PEBP) family uncharacterized protein